MCDCAAKMHPGISCGSPRCRCHDLADLRSQVASRTHLYGRDRVVMSDVLIEKDVVTIQFKDKDLSDGLRTIILSGELKEMSYSFLIVPEQPAPGQTSIT